MYDKVITSIVVRNCSCNKLNKMFNNMRRCLTVSVRIQRKFFTRSSHESVLSSELYFSSVNVPCSINAIYKRFYCHAVLDEPNLTSSELRNRKREMDKQKLDEFLSNPENNKRFQMLELEMNVMRHNAERVPNQIDPSDWLTLLDMRSNSKRKKYLDYLWRNEKTVENDKAKKALKKAEWLAEKKEQEENEDGGMKYGLLHNTMFMRIYDTTINRFYNGKLIQSLMFEPKIVFDCGYDNAMSSREIHNCAKQLSLAFASNRNHVDPLSLYFCNFNKDGLLKQHLVQNIPTLMQDDFPVVITSQSYLDIFPKNELVYLTPHCRVNLTEYDPDAIYIIGALVDKSNSQPLSLAKAKKEGIRMAKFPIDQYLTWGASSSRSLTLDQSIRIMLDLRHTGDWNEALKNTPTRKLKSAREQQLRYKLQRSMTKDLDQRPTPETKELKTPLNFTFQSRKIN